jgi:hypothetical protein
VAIGAATAMLGLASAALLTLPASAASNPPWEPDPNALGTLTFFNSSGQVVTGGSNLAHLFDFAEASSPTDPFNGTKATLVFAAPAPGVPTGTWFTGLGSASTAFPNASAPAPLNTATNPVVTLTSIDANLSNFIAQVPAQTQTGYANVFQIRLQTSGPGGVGSAPNGQYWDADVLVNPSAGTWTEEYPTQGSSTVSTTTTLSASPTGTAQQGAQVTLTATEVAADSTHPAGMVEFDQDGFSLGTAAVNSSGVATLQTSALLPSAPSGTKLTATFTPTSSGYNPSTSASLSYTVNPVAAVPTIAGPHTAGKTETCSEGTLDFGVTVSYAWFAGSTKIGTGASFVVPGTAYKAALTCQATVSDGGGTPNSATSAPVTVLRGGALTPITKPTLSGPHRVGRTESVKPGNWSKPGVSKVSFTYQWLLNGRAIRGATKSTLKLARSYRGKKISCRVTAHAPGFANGSATTASVKVR